MKSILKSLVVITAVAAIAGTATYSYFTDQGQVAGITFSTGTADLKIANIAVHEWFNGTVKTTDLTGGGYYKDTFNFAKEPFYPGKEIDGSLYLGNFSTAHIALQPTIQLTGYSENPNGFYNQMQMKVDWDGNATGSGWQDLTYFNTPRQLFNSPLPWSENAGYPDTAKALNIRLRMKSDAGNEWQKAAADLGFLFNATQVH